MAILAQAKMTRANNAAILARSTSAMAGVVTQGDGQRCKKVGEKSVGGRGRDPKVETIADARFRLASNLGFAARKTLEEV